MAGGWLPLGQAGPSPWHTWASCTALCLCCCCHYYCHWRCDEDYEVGLSGLSTFKMIWRLFSNLSQQHFNVRKLQVQDWCLELGHKSLHGGKQWAEIVLDGGDGQTNAKLVSPLSHCLVGTAPGACCHPRWGKKNHSSRLEDHHRPGFNKQFCAIWEQTYHNSLN